jgi:hypothetical protein
LGQNKIKTSKQCSGFGSVGSVSFWASRSGSISQWYGPGFGSRSRSFYQQEKKPDFYCFVTLYDFLSFKKNDVNVPFKSNKQKNSEKKIFCWRLEGHWQEEQDPDMDPKISGTDRRSGSVLKILLQIRNTASKSKDQLTNMLVCHQIW